MLGLKIGRKVVLNSNWLFVTLHYTLAGSDACLPRLKTSHCQPEVLRQSLSR